MIFIKESLEEKFLIIIILIIIDTNILTATNILATETALELLVYLESFDPQAVYGNRVDGIWPVNMWQISTAKEYSNIPFLVS